MHQDFLEHGTHMKPDKAYEIVEGGYGVKNAGLQCGLALGKDRGLHPQQGYRGNGH